MTAAVLALILCRVGYPRLRVQRLGFDCRPVYVLVCAHCLKDHP